MKLFSQIDSLNNQNKRAENNNELFSFHQNYQSNQAFPAFQTQKSKSKYSFKLQPQLYFQKRNEQKQKLYQLNSHITLLNYTEEDNNKISPKTQYQRKKIFSNDPRLSSQEKVEEKNTIPVISLPNQNQILKVEQQVPKEGKLYSRNLPQQTNQNYISPIYANKTINSSYQQRSNRRKINKISFDHEESNRFLIKPILEEPRRIPQASLQIYPNIQNITRSYPKLIAKVQQNEKQLMDISKKLDNKIIEDNNKQQYLIKLLAEKDRQSRQKDKQIQYLRSKKIENQKISCQIQQATRLQMLIFQNKHLTMKVQKEQQRLSQQKEKEDLQKINQRIEELKKMRQIQLQTTTNFANSSFNLDTSLVPHHYIGGEIPSKPLVNILKTQYQDNSSHKIKKVTFKYPTISQSQLIPQRDIPNNASAPKVKQIYVPLTRIY